LALAALAHTAQAPLAPLDETAFSRLVSSSRGNVLLVNFWATWCAPCREEMPQLASLQKKYGARGFRLATVSCDEPEDRAKAAQFLVKAGIGVNGAFWKQAADDDKFITFVDKTWSGALPALYLYDRSGKRVGSFIGETDLPALEAAIRKLLSDFGGPASICYLRSIWNGDRLSE
jgi:thiol-disulfide isomerase/thioredoxin